MGRRLTIRTLLPEDAILDLRGWKGVPEEWQREITVRPNLTIPEIAELFELNTTIRSLSDPMELQAPLEAAYERVHTILREQNPDLPNLPLDVKMTLDLMGWLAGDDYENIEDAVRDGISPALDGALQQPGGEGGEGLPVGDETPDAGAERAPLPSRKRSPKRSSRSASTSGSEPSGGSPAAGEPSEGTSSTSQTEAA